MRGEFSKKKSETRAKYRRSIVFSTSPVVGSEHYNKKIYFSLRMTMESSKLCLDALNFVKNSQLGRMSFPAAEDFGQTGLKIRQGVGNTGGREGKRNRQASLTGREN
jgi:hypothetical protein